MIVSDVMDRVKRSFGDESGVQITDADIIRWINDAQREMVKHNETLLEKAALTSTVADQQEYTMPADLLIFRQVSYKPTGYRSFMKLKGYSFVEFNELVDGYDGTEYPTGTPNVFTIHADKLILFPIPEESISNSLKIYYNRKPTDVVNSASTLDLPDSYFEPIVKYCLTQAYEMDEDWEAAGNKNSELMSDINLLKGRGDWKQQDVYPTITVRYEDMD